MHIYVCNEKSAMKQINISEWRFGDFVMFDRDYYFVELLF